jgi:hypothetical protein
MGEGYIRAVAIFVIASVAIFAKSRDWFPTSARSFLRIGVP